jgi:hypothetical protein
MDKFTFAEIALRAEARNYVEVADLDNDEPENRAGWARLRDAALNYARQHELAACGTARR